MHGSMNGTFVKRGATAMDGGVDGISIDTYEKFKDFLEGFQLTGKVDSCPCNSELWPFLWNYITDHG